MNDVEDSDRAKIQNRDTVTPSASQLVLLDTFQTLRPLTGHEPAQCQGSTILRVLAIVTDPRDNVLPERQSLAFSDEFYGLFD